MSPLRSSSGIKRPSRARASPAHDLVVRVTLRDIAPPIWRRILVPDRLSLHQTRRVLQLVFGWQDYHLYDFEFGSRRFELPAAEAEGESSTAMTLRELGVRVGTQFLYRYDFGDDWEHDMVVEEVRPRSEGAGEESWPALLDGARAGPPEDCGGPHGYAELVATLEEPLSAGYGELRQWVGPAYDPEVFDRWMVGRMLTLAVAWGAV